MRHFFGADAPTCDWLGLTGLREAQPSGGRITRRPAGELGIDSEQHRTRGQGRLLWHPQGGGCQACHGAATGAGWVDDRRRHACFEPPAGRSSQPGPGRNGIGEAPAADCGFGQLHVSAIRFGVVIRQRVPANRPEVSSISGRVEWAADCSARMAAAPAFVARVTIKIGRGLSTRKASTQRSGPALRTSIFAPLLHARSAAGRVRRREQLYAK